MPDLIFPAITVLFFAIAAYVRLLGRGVSAGRDRTCPGLVRDKANGQLAVRTGRTFRSGDYSSANR